jgi:hypothetical protein
MSDETTTATTTATTTTATATTATATTATVSPEVDRICTRCHVFQPIEAFAKKRNGRARTCKACQREYNKQYYVDNRERLLPKLKERKTADRTARRDQLKEHRSLQQCVRCRGAHNLKAVGVTESPSDMIRRQRPAAELAAVLEAATWMCDRCIGQDLADTAAGRQVDERRVFLDDVILDVCDGLALPFPHVFAEVIKVRPTTKQSVRVRLSQLTIDGLLERTDRGVYLTIG